MKKCSRVKLLLFGKSTIVPLYVGQPKKTKKFLDNNTSQAVPPLGPNPQPIVKWSSHASPPFFCTTSSSSSTEGGRGGGPFRYGRRRHSRSRQCWDERRRNFKLQCSRFSMQFYRVCANLKSHKRVVYILQLGMRWETAAWLRLFISPAHCKC